MMRKKGSGYELVDGRSSEKTPSNLREILKDGK